MITPFPGSCAFSSEGGDAADWNSAVMREFLYWNLSIQEISVSGSRKSVPLTQLAAIKDDNQGTRAHTAMLLVVCLS